MATWVNLRHHFSSIRIKKIGLYYLPMIMGLCSLSYLIGLYHHGGFSGGSTTSPAAAATTTTVLIPCDTNKSFQNISKSIHTINSSSAAVAAGGGAAFKLDFAAHHTADEIEIKEKKKVEQIPPCGVEFSEYTPCEDEQRSLKFKRSMSIFKERHCPEKNEVLKCRIPAPFGYKSPFRWPESRDNVWYDNVPHKHLTVEKARQNWVRFKGDRFTFPGGGTMFQQGADVYINDIGKLINLRDGSIRTAVDTGCGVASWGAYLLSRNILPLSFAPRDTHEAQIHFALERGIPALIGILASIRLPYPSRAFDMAHCSRCLIPWGLNDGLYLIEIDRILRPGGYWILSGPPINWQSHWKGWERTREDLKAEQDGIENITRSLCWKKLVQKNDIAIWQKPTNHIHCKINRKVFKKPQFCQSQDPDRAWYTKMEGCLTPLPEVSDIKQIAGGQLAKWPERLTAVPPRITTGSLNGISAKTFEDDTSLWKKRVAYYKKLDYQLAEPGNYRNLLDMNAYLGGFAAAMVDDPVWVMNVVPVEANVTTLGVIFERGLIGTYQNWCEAMSTYPRTYDLIHASLVFSLYKNRCDMEDIVLEMDRILRPRGSVIFRDDVDVLEDVLVILEKIQWEGRLVDHEDGPHQREKILIANKLYWTAPKLAADKAKQ